MNSSVDWFSTSVELMVGKHKRNRAYQTLLCQRRDVIADVLCEKRKANVL